MDKILEKIESDKEVLSTLPKNNDKNITLYIEKVDELRKYYSEKKELILTELNKRYKSFVDIKISPEIKQLQTQIEEIENMLEILDTTSTSYEKMGLDRKIYTLGRFYKENLENINEEILSCIEKFKEVGIELTPEDFDYSIYVSEYMQVFFQEAKKKDVNSDTIKNKFEEIYWKCPDIIIHIELNLRYLYIKKQAIIDKYYDKKREQLLENINNKTYEMKQKYINLNKKLMQKMESDKALIIQKFVTGKINTKDYQNNKIQDNYEHIISKQALKTLDKEEINENIIKFINSLYEYKNFMRFNFIFQDIKKKYIEREQHKNEYNTIKKEIIKKEKKLKSLNKKINGKGFLLKKKKENKEKQNAEYNKLILDIKATYKRLDDAEVYTKIIEKLNDSSTIYEALNFASNFDIYLTECIIANNPEIEPNDIEKLIIDFKKFLKNPYNIIIKNIAILEEKDVSMIISDRYKLLSFNIRNEDISIENADNLISTLTTIETKNNMDKTKINVEDMEFLCDYKKKLKIK